MYVDCANSLDSMAGVLAFPVETTVLGTVIRFYMGYVLALGTILRLMLAPGRKTGTVWRHPIRIAPPALTGRQELPLV